MAGTIASEIMANSDAAFARLTRQLDGLEPYADRSDAPGQWTARAVLAHMLADPVMDPTAALGMFADRDRPTLNLELGKSRLTPERQRMSLKQLADALAQERQRVKAWVAGLSDDELMRRKARVPALAGVVGSEEVSLAMFARAVLELHLNDHAGQLGKIRKAVGLPEVG
jgi:hypothetical protein